MPCCSRSPATGLWRRGLRIPGGLLITVAVTMAPLFVYGVQDALGWWTHAEPATTATSMICRDQGRAGCRWSSRPSPPGSIALRFYRFPFLVAPIAVALWFMSMDLVPWIFGEDWDSWEQRRMVSLWFGLGMLLVAWAVDLRARGDFAFWLHLFGLLAFWCGLTAAGQRQRARQGALLPDQCSACSGSALFLQRRAYAVFGALGVAALSPPPGRARCSRIRCSIPFALSLIGLAVIGAGLLLHRHAPTLERLLAGPLAAGRSPRLRPAHAR